jgi:virulence factor MgtC-like protein
MQGTIYFRYARTRPIRSSANSTVGIGLFSCPIMCKRIWSPRTSAIRLLIPPRTLARSINTSAQSSPVVGERSMESTLTLHALHSGDLDSSGKVEVRATLVSAERQNAMLEDIVQRLSPESGITAVSWEAAAHETE